MSWFDDGHTIMLAIVEDEIEVVGMTCPGEGQCKAGYVLCDDVFDGCSGGEIYGDDDELVRDCPTCRGTGKKDGEYHCWLTSPDGHLAGYSWNEALFNNIAEFEPGTYRASVAPNGEGPEEWFVMVRIGDRIAPPGSAETE